MVFMRTTAFLTYIKLEKMSKNAGFLEIIRNFAAPTREYVFSLNNYEYEKNHEFRPVDVEYDSFSPEEHRHPV